MALLPFACGEKKLITSSSKKVSPVAPGAGHTQPGTSSAHCARFQLDGPVAAVPVSLQDVVQIGEKENVHAGVRRQLLVQSRWWASARNSPAFKSSRVFCSRRKK